MKYDNLKAILNKEYLSSNKHSFGNLIRMLLIDNNGNSKDMIKYEFKYEK